ncbi:ABC transporter permease [Streptomyces sp. ISL-10]|uniref:ABC transporter permease n=1 Tax=Streptomyces sp. ISL-10 TaxID=2819172 RepID=UPI001BE7858C|nr:ABC transporter permease [Streptomyces sp. ISL-10]MBT2370168.1 ABC transporter permease [Streptomyces sp. ISL-10]
MAVSLVIVALVVVAVAGPWLAPHAPTDVVGLPYAPPGPGLPLGTDYLGGDVASRLLHGGRTVVMLALAASFLGYLVGGGIGLAAGLFGHADSVLMRPVDVLLALPPFLLLAVLAAGTGRGTIVVVMAAVLANAPGIARVVRAATLEVGVRGYVEVALARGESWPRVAARDVLPNIAAPMLTDVGSRVSATIAMVAGANFLGLGLQPPTADWALMVAENRAGLALQPWAVLAPALTIAVLTIAVNLGGDEIAARLRRATTAVTTLRGGIAPSGHPVVKKAGQPVVKKEGAPS